jgi:hypothetical protein
MSSISIGSGGTLMSGRGEDYSSEAFTWCATHAELMSTLSQWFMAIDCMCFLFNNMAL